MNPKDQQPADQPKTNPFSTPSSANEAPAPAQSDQPQFVYMTRPMEPKRQKMSPEIQKKHEESKRLYPKLNLSAGEYVISSVKRHWIGLFSIWFATIAVVMGLVVATAFIVRYTGEQSNFEGVSLPITYVAIPALLLAMLALVFGFVSAMIYSANRFYLTNESVIQHIQISLFSLREQTISLANIEDASYGQDGILPHLFDYGLIRLSTQGDETTYRFSYASQPKQQIALLNNAVEDFKNVRPMEG